MNQESIFLMLILTLRVEKDSFGYWGLRNDPYNAFSLPDGMARGYDDECLYRKFLLHRR